jgi:hypothetical protein
VVTGHHHYYERFAPLDPLGRADTTRGVREFIVGTGGFNHDPITQPLARNSEVHDYTTFGVLALTLRSGGYDWRFLPAPPGGFTDSGSASCHPKRRKRRL